MPHAHAEVTTGRPERYRKQLASHLGSRCTIDEEPESTRITLPTEHARGWCSLTARTDILVLDAVGETTADLRSVQDVIGRHLERFGERDGLTVTWDT